MHHVFICETARFLRSLSLLLFELVLDLGNWDQNLSFSSHRRRGLLRLKVVESVLFPCSLGALLDKLIELRFKCLHLKLLILTHNLLSLFPYHQVRLILLLFRSCIILLTVLSTLITIVILFLIVIIFGCGGLGTMMIVFFIIVVLKFIIVVLVMVYVVAAAIFHVEGKNVGEILTLCISVL